MATVIKTPPNNEEAEQSVLGAILIDKNSIGLIANDLFPDDFYSDTNAKIYQAMLELYEAGKPIDLLTLTKRLKKNKATEIEASYLTDLVNTVPTAANIEHYADIIKEDSTKRKLISLGTKMTDMGFSEEIGADELLDKAESYIFSISKGYSMEGFVPVKESLAASFDRIDEIHKQGAGLRGVKSGFTDLDNILSGFQDSNLIILAARPGQGKTAMVVNIAQNIAVNDKKPVGIFSLEMSQEELVDRLLIGQADVDAWRLKTGRLSETDFAKLSEAMGVLADAPIFIDDTPGISVSQIRTKARKLQMEHDLAILIVDYLQLVDPGKRYDNRVMEVSIVSQALKNLARELKIPLLAVSQLSRAVEHRGERRPQLADLRESGAIEQDSDVVMFLYRPDSEISSIMQTKVLIAKHRNGPMGEIELLFRGDRIRFYNVEGKRKVEEEEPPTATPIL
ncbi:MAG: Replicative DNA helicase [Candidatus Woesebacteria bacterium GW2011_GWB1_38_5b]|uniref:Replicative DNA helicase n=1 Tax=Candidatus Woesebacteria bacterium GW2011_GWB1_38_5b TaxID=1618569 RepID=A0A0G0K796_9BACT|nr:MAG: Replicative DNA helicase [Candidatus Woesebacteria bacterium GW2011_GWB1_38_5b]OGH47532.1 MAG: replicative DNA helicase [Candidatus Levybacteria bacterium RIFCSPLOWO2_01_FULL_39_10]